MSDRRKQIEDAAALEFPDYLERGDPQAMYDGREAFIAGVEWADENNAEIPPLRSFLADVERTVLEMKDRKPEQLDVSYLAALCLEARVALAKTPAATPTPGDEDRGT